MEKELLEFEAIFLYDISIKEKLFKNVLYKDELSNDILVHYQDKLIKLLDYCEDKITRIFLINFNDTKINTTLETFFDNIKDKLIHISISNKNLREFYNNYFANLDRNLVNLSANTFVAYTSININETENVIKKCKTINEILHVAHSLTVNNDNLIKKLPGIDKEFNYTISINNEIISMSHHIRLHGKNTFLSQQLYESLLDINTGDIDITSLSLCNKILIMINGKGYTTIEIQESNDKIFIHYFIPKLKDELIVDNLPGVRKVDNSYITGGFMINIYEIIKIKEFINKIPDNTLINESNIKIK